MTVFTVVGKTQYLVDEALKIKATGVEKAFEKEFAEMENNIQEIRDIIRNANVSSNDIKDIEMNLKQLRSAVISYIQHKNKGKMGIDKIDCIFVHTKILKDEFHWISMKSRFVRAARETSKFHKLSRFINSCRCYMVKILQIRRKTLYNQSINLNFDTGWILHKSLEILVWPFTQERFMIIQI